MYSSMLSLSLLLICLAQQVLSRPSPPANVDLSNFDPANIIWKDVAIIGGGSSGCYSAISLKDKGKSVVVIETTDRVGGNTQTYIDPVTGTPVDIGVLVFHNISIVRDYFARFDIPLTLYTGSNDQQSAYHDFRTGRQLTDLVFPSANETAMAFTKYGEFLSQYPKLNDGLFLPDPVPDDLVLPFGEFATKYDVGASLNVMYELDPAVGNFTTVPTVERMRTMGLSLVEQIATGFLTTAHHNNSEIYSRIQAELLSASSLLLNSQVIWTQRGNEGEGVQLLVQTPEGWKLVFAKKLLMTIPPKLDLLKAFDMGNEEESVFSKFIDVGYYTSLLKNTGLPDDLSVFNYNPDTGPYYFPSLPAVYNVQSTPAPGLHQALYGTPRSAASFPLSDEQVKADIIRNIKCLQRTNPAKFNATEPEFVIFSSHTPFYLQVHPDDIKSGFYQKLYALQGLKNTFWTGAAFRGQDSSDLWRFCEDVVLPPLLKGL